MNGKHIPGQAAMATLAVLALAAVSVQASAHGQSAVPDTPPAPPTRTLAEVDHLVAELYPVGNSGIRGIAHFRAVDGGVEVQAEIEGLADGKLHGFHIHEAGDCTAPDASSAGAHLDPDENRHDLPPDTPRHAGDLGNIEASDSGRATYRLVVDNISLASGDDAIVGRGLIIHDEADEGSQPSGDAGERLACGVIGIAAQPGMGR